jgi:hypothetical protein
VLALHLLSGYLHPDIPPLSQAPHESSGHVTPAKAGSNAALRPGTGRVVLLVAFGPAPGPGEKPGDSFKAHPMHVMRAQAAALGMPLQYCEASKRAPTECGSCCCWRCLLCCSCCSCDLAGYLTAQDQA